MSTGPDQCAVVLLSGGLDSATVLALARRDGLECHALSFDYGQRHAHELDAAKAVATRFGVARHTVLPLNLALFGGSALTDPTQGIPRDRPDEAIAQGIPTTYVPARNLVFLSIATALAEAVGAGSIHIGVNQLDYSGYPDCRSEFIDAFQHAAALATRTGVEGAPIRIHTPLIDMTKAQIIRLGNELGVDYALTTSCYDPDAEGRACGRCDACRLRSRGFEAAGLPDPTTYTPTARQPS